MLEFRKFSDFSRGTVYDLLQDAYLYNARNQKIWDLTGRRQMTSSKIVLRSLISTE